MPPPQWSFQCVKTFGLSQLGGALTSGGSSLGATECPVVRTSAPQPRMTWLTMSVTLGLRDPSLETLWVIRGRAQQPNG